MYLNQTDTIYNSLKISVMVSFDFYVSQTKKSYLIKLFFYNLTNCFERVPDFPYCLESEPEWNLDVCKVEYSDEVNYLGAILSNSSSKHIENRITKCRSAFYSLQGAEMCEHRVEPKVKSYRWKTAL